MNIKEKNYWLDTVAEPAMGATSVLPDKVDVAIVGGGFCTPPEITHIVLRRV